MAKIDFNKIPKFSQLPVKAGAPADSNWGVFGDDDEVGCVNFLTPEGIVEAAKLVRNGKVFRLDTPINYASPPLFNREPVHHTKKSFESYGLLGFDDVLDSYNTQEGSQWDGLGHVGNLKAQAYYNGVKNDADQGLEQARHPQLGRSFRRPRRADRRLPLSRGGGPSGESAERREI